MINIISYISNIETFIKNRVIAFSLILHIKHTMDIVLTQRGFWVVTDYPFLINGFMYFSELLSVKTNVDPGESDPFCCCHFNMCATHLRCFSDNTGTLDDMPPWCHSHYVSLGWRILMSDCQCLCATTLILQQISDYYTLSSSQKKSNAFQLITPVLNMLTVFITQQWFLLFTSLKQYVHTSKSQIHFRFSTFP